MQEWWQNTFPQGCQYLTINDAKGTEVKIAYGEKGTGKPLVFVHGLGNWSIGWRENIDFFAQYFRVIVFDFKGYGFSEKLGRQEESGYQIPELKRILKALCTEPAVIVAESLGGVFSLAVAEEYPHLIACLVLISPSVFPQDLPSPNLRSMAEMSMILVRVMDFVRFLKLFPQRSLSSWREMREQLLVRREVTSEDVYGQAYPFLEFRHAYSRLVLDVKQAQQEIRKLQNNQPCSLKKIQDNLLKVTCPTLILQGDSDSWVSRSEVTKLNECLPNSHLKLISNCGHDAATDCPEEFNSMVLAFLQDIKLVEVM
jgi:pimeloyl-ACP methyl ester carboxylesterase